LLTHPVHGLENFCELIDTLTSAKDAIKVYCEVAPLGGDARKGVAVGSLASAATR